jgi:DNA-binding transcriptional regulator YiaG
MNEFKVYVGKLGMVKVLVLDERIGRKRERRKLPRGEEKEEIVKVCKEIEELRTKYMYSWTAVAEIYGKHPATIKYWYSKHCKPQKL